MVEVLVGPNRFALQKTVQQVRDGFIGEHGELAVESFDGEEAELQDIQAALQSVSLFTPTKMVIVKALGNHKEASEKIQELVDATHSEAKLLIVEPKPDKRSTYYKTLKKTAKFQEFPELDEPRLVDWLINEAKASGAELARNDARYLVSRVGGSQAKLSTEIRKLIDYSPHINRKNINLLCEENPQNTVFELLDALFNRQLERTFSLYDNLRTSGSQPQMVLAMIIWQMHQVALVFSAQGRSIDEISRDSGAKPYTLNKSKSIANKLSAREIRQILTDVQNLDRQLKTQSVDPDDAVMNLLSAIATS